MLELDEELAANELIFPTAEMTARLHQFRATTAEEETSLGRGILEGVRPSATGAPRA